MVKGGLIVDELCRCFSYSSPWFMITRRKGALTVNNNLLTVHDWCQLCTPWDSKFHWYGKLWLILPWFYCVFIEAWWLLLETLRFDYHFDTILLFRRALDYLLQKRSWGRVETNVLRKHFWKPYRCLYNPLSACLWRGGRSRRTWDWPTLWGAQFGVFQGQIPDLPRMLYYVSYYTLYN